jgi:hypothetical protein
VSLVNTSTSTTIAKQAGASPVWSSANVPSGNYLVVVSASGNASFTLTVTYPQA